MSGPEIFVIIIVILILFGADKLPEIARSFGKGMRDFKKATDDIRREIETSTSEIKRDFNDVGNTITTTILINKLIPIIKLQLPADNISDFSLPV
jgi:sec-independent protein translocase protein TatA